MFVTVLSDSAVLIKIEASFSCSVVHVFIDSKLKRNVKFIKAAMISKPRRGAQFVARTIWISFTSVAAIDNHGNQFHIVVDDAIGGMASNFSALQLDTPKESESQNGKHADTPAKADTYTSTHSHVFTAQKEDLAPASFEQEHDLPPATSEIECPCARELKKSSRRFLYRV